MTLLHHSAASTGTPSIPAAPSATPILALPTYDVAVLEEGLYVVLAERDTLGYVHRVGNVFVALSGSDLGRAVEVGQTLSWQRAVDIVAAG